MCIRDSSGAGAVLPNIAVGLAPRPRLILFVDAGIPPCEGVFTTGGDFLPALLELASDGILPKWSKMCIRDRCETARDGR